MQKESSTIKLLPKDQVLPPLNVRIKFMDFPCIEISEDDFINSEKDESKEDDSTTKSSKDLEQPERESSTAKSSVSDQVKSSKSVRSASSKDSSKPSSKTSGKSDSKVKRTGSKPNVSISTGKYRSEL